LPTKLKTRRERETAQFAAREKAVRNRVLKRKKLTLQGGEGQTATEEWTKASWDGRMTFRWGGRASCSLGGFSQRKEADITGRAIKKKKTAKRKLSFLRNVYGPEGEGS